MPERNQAALDFLLSRRSRPAKTLTTPVPDRAALTELLTAGLRSPDHGKLEPWRLIVLEEPALKRLGALALSRADALGQDAAQAEKAALPFLTGALAVAVIESPVPSEKVPAIEQSYSAGAVCLSLLNAALAAGWGANWLSGWVSHDRTFCAEGLELTADEKIAGIIHIGTERMAPPERPRPNLAEKVTWQSA
ncbi:nitroreductase family protein [Cognatishimia sp. SS12]|uniref:nitroreductase family protein n=1 Tax=Cognatishimia sp. SS12 TaxID=2979465 RepID=UPI00233106B6|nr:nitroreductase family protein [Cognatishimia sp. SS12]MDC0738162.1 nitroreductase family protein [Cognatishimia sp. SS12]